MADILPDSRARVTRGVVCSAEHGNLIPIFCANCGKKWGMVPEEHITFAFALCDKCEEAHGAPAHLYAEPDSVFWERVANAQAEKEIDMSNPLVVAKQLEDPSSIFSKLAEEWRQHTSSKSK